MNREIGRGRPRPPDPIFHVDDAYARDAIIWVHRRMFYEYFQWPQSLFWEVQNNQFVQIYTERRQQLILSYRLHRNPGLYRDIFNIANAVVTERIDRQDDQIEFVNRQGERASFVTVFWEYPEDSFHQALGAELVVQEIIHTEITRENDPNAVIITLMVNYPPIR